MDKIEKLLFKLDYKLGVLLERQEKGLNGEVTKEINYKLSGALAKRDLSLMEQTRQELVNNIKQGTTRHSK